MTDADTARSLRRAALLWFGLYLGVSVGLFLLFSFVDALPETTGLPTLSFGLGAVITGIALIAVIADRLLFERTPTDVFTRQSLWVLVLVVATASATTFFLVETALVPGTAVALGVSVAVPATMILFALVNLLRHRSLEHG
ncbi:hypothetical protein [Halorubrum vacuolatum]|uniref:Uncharacterized protein n=1 Tax=Halorubrum vacuolatum TaxID=63740 RepID=A0A238WPI1_HALVU|nr:hypothetical protein [Halorubrum vacuolatum]SNR47589.1 hypothetical protein SAMN06264855_108144 [Halorubrum vacuolatum]